MWLILLLTRICNRSSVCWPLKLLKGGVLDEVELPSNPHFVGKVTSCHIDPCNSCKDYTFVPCTHCVCTVYFSAVIGAWTIAGWSNQGAPPITIAYCQTAPPVNIYYYIVNK